MEEKEKSDEYEELKKKYDDLRQKYDKINNDFKNVLIGANNNKKTELQPNEKKKDLHEFLSGVIDRINKKKI